MPGINYGILQPTQASQVSQVSAPQGGDGGGLGGILGDLGSALKGIKGAFGQNPVSTANAAVQQGMNNAPAQQVAASVLPTSMYKNPQAGTQPLQGMQQQINGAIQKPQTPGQPQTNSQQQNPLSVGNVFQSAQQVFPNNPVMAKLATSQATIESGLSSGQPSGLAVKGNNLFGMKGEGDAGSITMPTKEYINGKLTTVNSQFAKYSSPQASMQAYSDLMTNNPRYKDVINAPDFETAAQNVQKAGYATDPNYSKSLTSIGKNIDSPIAQTASIHNAVQASSGNTNSIVNNGGNPNAMKVASAYLGDGVNNHAEVLSDFFQKSGVGKVDPKTTPWCAAFANSVLASTGATGTGSLAARSFLNYGTPTKTPSQGDIVVTSDLTGANNPAHGHVGFFAGMTDDGTGVKILGGNESGAVSIKTYPASKVLGYRQAPTVGELQAGAQGGATASQLPVGAGIPQHPANKQAPQGNSGQSQNPQQAGPTYNSGNSAFNLNRAQGSI